MPEPPGDYQDFLFDTDALLAQVKLYRGIVGSAARGGKGGEALLVMLLPDLEELLGEVRGVLTGAERGRQKVGSPEPPGDAPDPGFRTGLLPPRGKWLWLIIRFAAVGDATALGSLPGFLPDLEQLLGAVEAAMTQRNRGGNAGRGMVCRETLQRPYLMADETPPPRSSPRRQRQRTMENAWDDAGRS